MSSSSPKKSVSSEEITVDILKKMHRQNQMIISLLKEIKNSLQAEESPVVSASVPKGRSRKQYVHVVEELVATEEKTKKPKAKAPKKKVTPNPLKGAEKKSTPKKKKSTQTYPKITQVVLSEESLLENSLGEDNPFIFSEQKSKQKDKL